VASISYKRHRFPPVVIQHAVWLYFRFTFSLRDVEEMRNAAVRGEQSERGKLAHSSHSFRARINAARVSFPEARWAHAHPRSAI
jgi:putative transposase